MHKNGCNERESVCDSEREREGWRERGGAMETRKRGEDSRTFIDSRRAVGAKTRTGRSELGSLPGNS